MTLTYTNTLEVEKAIAQYRQSGHVEDRNRAVELCLPLVRQFAATIVSGGSFGVVDFDDLSQAGAIGATHAVERYDPAKGQRFTTFAWPRIDGAMRDLLRATDTATRTQRALHAAGKPSAVRKTLSLSRSMRGDGRATTFAAQWADPRSDQAMAHVDRDDFFDVYLDGLPRNEQLAMRLYYAEGFTSSEVGRVLGVVESRVSHLRKASLDSLRIAFGVAPSEGQPQ